MNDAYRTNMKIQRPKLPRIRARLRGLWRRIVIPTFASGIVILAGIIFGLFLSAKGCVEGENERQKGAEAVKQADVHFNDWQKTINERQAKFDSEVSQFKKSMEPSEAHTEHAMRKAEELQGELEMKLREADYHKELQVPALINGNLSSGSNDFHGLHVSTDSKPIICYVQRDGVHPIVNCILTANASKN